MRGCITLKKLQVFGARLHIHWSVLVAAGVVLGAQWRQPILAFVAVVAYFSVILLHEAGHAWAAQRLGYHPSDIYLTFIHGLCVLEEPDTLRDHAIIAWGGVLAQIAFAIPLVVMGQVIPARAVPFLPVAVSILGYMSLLIALLNLAPVRGLDGALAWKLVPILWRNARSWFASRKAAKDVLRRFK